MNLYESVVYRIDVQGFVNDTILSIGGYLTWQELVDNHRLSAEAESEHAASLAYWQGKYDSAITDTERDAIREKQQTSLGNACIGAERRQINEQEFYEIIGYEGP